MPLTQNLPLTQIDKNNIMMIVSIELESMFVKLSNHYSHADFAEHLLMLPEIELSIRAGLLDTYNSK